MLKALDLSKTISHESELDEAKGTENASRFTLGGIHSRVYMVIKDRATKFAQDATGDMSVSFSGNAVAYELVKFGLRDVQNFENNTPFKREKIRIGNTDCEVVTDEYMATLDPDLIRELSEQITKLCEFSKDEAKNSAG